MVPLHIAARNGNIELIQLLLEFNDQNDIKSKHCNKTATQYAEENGHENACFIIMQKSSER